MGFLGVIAGAILATGTQAVIALLDRKRQARTAARLLLSTVVEGIAAIEAAYDGEEFVPFGFDWDEIGAAWTEHREALASALNTAAFLEVAIAFIWIAHLTRIRSDFLGIAPGPPHEKSDFSAVAKAIEDHRAEILRARDVLFWAALTPAERRKKQPAAS